MLHKLMMLSASFMLCIHSLGCITIRQSQPSRFCSISNCSEQHTANATTTDECCEPYDRRDALRQLAKKLKPSNFVPAQAVVWAGNCKDHSRAWLSNQCGRCAAVKGSVQGWIQAKKDEANAPPWPRFHPVPTQNVFEPQDVEFPVSADAPEVYGRFGKG